MPEMTPEQVANAVEVFAKEAIAWADEQSPDRIRAMEYYDGVMKDTPSDVGRSSITSRDFRAITKKVLPAITRTIFGSDRVVEYLPVGTDDEQRAEEATDYINNVVMIECRAEEKIRDGIHDALRLCNGIMKWWAETRIDVKVSRHSGLDMEELTTLAADDAVEILEQAQDAQGLFSVKLRKRTEDRPIMIGVIPLEEFFISPDALSIDDAVFVAHNQRLKRYQLVAMGYDRDKVRSIPAYSARPDQSEEEDTRRGNIDSVSRSERIRDMEEVDYWECFVRLDQDDDGIAELRRIVFAGGWTAEHILENDDADEAPFTDLVVERRPHEWRGRSLFDDTSDTQRIKTVLMRSTLDNIYAQNNLQPIFQKGAIDNPDSVYSPAFGKPIVVSSGIDVRAAIGDRVVPMVAKDSFAMLTYFDDALSDLTGITDASGGLPPDALQNVTAKASALMEQQGISQVELMTRNIAVGLKRLFRGVLRLVVQHQDKQRVVRLRGKMMTFDPRYWNTDMDVSVNIGLGAGTRERDMMAMQVVIGTQEKLLATMGADNPFVKPDQLYNAIAKLYQAAGIKNIDGYLTRPDPEEVQRKMQEAANQPPPEMLKAQAQMQVEQFKAGVQMQIADKKMQADASKEREQRDADLIVKRAELDAERERTMVDADARMQTEAAKIGLQGQTTLERELLLQENEHAFEREKMAHDARQEQSRMENDNFNREADRNMPGDKK